MTTKLSGLSGQTPPLSAGEAALLPERDEEFWLAYRNLDTLQTIEEVESHLVELYVDNGDLDGYSLLLGLQQERRLFSAPKMVQA